MQQTFNLPQYKAVTYYSNPETGYFTKTTEQPHKTPVMRLPYQLRVMSTQAAQIKCNAKELIASKEKTKTGHYKFFTGLQHSNFKNWFVGNDYEKLNGVKVLSLILFHFSEDNSRLTVYYFARYDKENSEMRIRFANSIIPILSKNHTTFSVDL